MSSTLPARVLGLDHRKGRIAPGYDADLVALDADLNVRMTWVQGRVCLLGDAAHPMYPVGSNGSAQAILDARCLTDLLAAHDAPAALDAYDARRRPATAEVVRSNRAGGPERVIDLVASRAPGGFQAVGDVATQAELAGIVRGYAQLAGFAVAT